MARGCSPSLPGVPLPPPPHGPCIRKGSHLGRRLPEEASEVMASFSAQAWSGQLSPGQSRRQRTGRDPARRGGGRWPLTCPPLAWQMGPEAEWLGQVPPPQPPSSWNGICLCLKRGCGALSLQTEAAYFPRALTQRTCKCHCAPLCTQGCQGPCQLSGCCCGTLGRGGIRRGWPQMWAVVSAWQGARAGHGGPRW